MGTRMELIQRAEAPSFRALYLFFSLSDRVSEW